MKVLPRLLVLLALALFLPLNPAAAERAGASVEENASEAEAPKEAPKDAPKDAPKQEEPAAVPKLGRALPFNSIVHSLNPEDHSFSMGKKKIRRVYVTETTRIVWNDGKPATFADLQPGVEIRGSTKKRATGELEAATVKIGPKLAAIQASSAEED